MSYKNLPENLDDDALNREQVKTIKQMLNSKNKEDMHLALELLEGINLYKLSLRDLNLLFSAFSKEGENKLNSKSDEWVNYRFYKRSIATLLEERKKDSREQYKQKQKEKSGEN